MIRRILRHDEILLLFVWSLSSLPPSLPPSLSHLLLLLLPLRQPVDEILKSMREGTVTQIVAQARNHHTQNVSWADN